MTKGSRRNSHIKIMSGTDSRIPNRWRKKDLCYISSSSLKPDCTNLEIILTWCAKTPPPFPMAAPRPLGTRCYVEWRKGCVVVIDWLIQPPPPPSAIMIHEIMLIGVGHLNLLIYQPLRRRGGVSITFEEMMVPECPPTLTRSLFQGILLYLF